MSEVVVNSERNKPLLALLERQYKIASDGKDIAIKVAAMIQEQKQIIIDLQTQIDNGDIDGGNVLVGQVREDATAFPSRMWELYREIGSLLPPAQE